MNYVHILQVQFKSTNDNEWSPEYVEFETAAGQKFRATVYTEDYSNIEEWSDSVGFSRIH